jgi:hypothetical protein
MHHKTWNSALLDGNFKPYIIKGMSENQIVTEQAYFAQKTGFPCPSVGIESGLHRSQSQCTTLLKPIRPAMHTDQLFLACRA